jgi:hypothetical protein
MEKTSFPLQENASAKFLVRRVGHSIRGFLSRRYALHLSTTPLLQRFIGYCAEQRASPIEALRSDIRLSLKCFSKFVYQPVPRQFLVMGLSFHNSDFGAGTFTVAPTVFDPIRHTSAVFAGLSLETVAETSEAFKRVHLGPMLSENDLNTVRSDRAKRIDDVSRIVRAATQKQLGRSWAEAVCEIVKKAHENKIPWNKLRRELAPTLLKEELERIEKMLREKSPFLPQLGQKDLELDADGLPIPNRWWASTAVSFIARETPDEERRMDLQEAAGVVATRN